MPQYRVRHTTKYTYDEPVRQSYGDLCLLPREFPGQQRISARLDISPTPADRSNRLDYYGNHTTYFAIHESHAELTITATSTVQVDGTRGAIPLGAERPWRAARDEVATHPDLHLEAAQFRLPSSQIAVDARVLEYAQPSFGDDVSIVDALADLAHRIHTDFEFDPAVTTVESTIDDLFEHGAGVCQDFAHLGVACVRAMGMSGRYVSGYLETDPPAGQPRLQGADVSHAWFSVLVPGGDWIDVDPTNDQFVNARYVTTAWGRDYNDVTPVKGVIYSDGGMSSLAVEVDVVRE